MSYEIDEAIQDAENVVEIRKKIREAFPDVTFESMGKDWRGRDYKVWVSHTLESSDCDGVEIRVLPAMDSKRDEAVFVLFKQCDGFKVYSRYHRERSVISVLKNLQEKQPGLYGQLVKAVFESH